MKKNNWKNKAAIFISCIYSFTAMAQITPGQLKQFISESKYTGNTEIREFYTRMNYSTAWIQNENTLNRNIFLNTLKLSAEKSLRESDYLVPFSSNSSKMKNAPDSLEAELRITEAAIHFYKDIAYGNTKPGFGYDGLAYTPGCINIPQLLADHILKSELQSLMPGISAPFPELPAIENKIRWFIKVMSDSNFSEINIISGKILKSNIPLISKLCQLGIIEPATKDLPDSLLKQKIKEAQRLFNLLPDGTLRSTILQELNIPLSVRLQQLNLSVNYYRWLYCLIQNQPVIVVNIPAAYLKVYRNRDIILEMRVIVGKRSTPTPALASIVNEVILYPYWHVPYSIATKELLPAIKRDPGYINAGNYQVLNKSGKIIDPYSINWHTLSTGYFPYIIRQSTGCDNALGLLKLNFDSPFGVYLHDTPNKNLFMLKKRFLSHGCIRMQNPMSLGHLVLKNNVIAIDTLEQKGCLLNQSPIIVHADEHMPVIVWYNPVGIDTNGKLLFYEDIYGRFNRVKSK